MASEDEDLLLLLWLLLLLELNEEKPVVEEEEVPHDVGVENVEAGEGDEEVEGDDEKEKILDLAVFSARYCPMVLLFTEEDS